MKTLLLSLAAVASSGAWALNFDYMDFADTSMLVANQNYGYGPIFTDNVLRLTDGGGYQAGSAWYAEAVPIFEFQTSFRFRMYSGSDPRADGIMFVIQNSGTDALGPAGGGLGFGPDNSGAPNGIGRSVGIKFDNYDNQGEGTSSTGLFFDGQAPTNEGSVDLAGTGIDFQTDAVFQVDLFYDGLLLEMTIANVDTGAMFGVSYNVDILNVVGSDMAYIGFTAGTGGLQQISDVQSWSYNATPVPEPATLAIVGLGVLALARRRRR